MPNSDKVYQFPKIKIKFQIIKQLTTETVQVKEKEQKDEYHHGFFEKKKQTDKNVKIHFEVKKNNNFIVVYKILGIAVILVVKDPK